LFLPPRAAINRGGFASGRGFSFSDSRTKGFLVSGVKAKKYRPQPVEQLAGNLRLNPTLGGMVASPSLPYSFNPPYPY
jgi:hypothetical protein